MNQYVAGSLVTVTATFTDAVTGNPADPTTVTLKVGRKYTADMTSTYISGTLTGPYTITKVSTGNYSANIDTSAFPQSQYTYQWSGTGGVQAITAGIFAVTTAPLT